MSRRFSVTIVCVVHDEEKLRQYAAAQAAADGISPADWRDTREGPEDDLQMLLDRGLPDAAAGFEIEQSFAAVETE